MLDYQSLHTHSYEFLFNGLAATRGIAFGSKSDLDDTLARVASSVCPTNKAALVAADHGHAGEHPLTPDMAVALTDDLWGGLATHADHSCSDANASVQPIFSM